MFFLSCLFFLLIIISFIDILKIDRASKILILSFIGFLLFLSASLRIGDRDYQTYLDIFSKASPFFERIDYSDFQVELGYLFLNRLIKSIGGDVVIVFMIMAFLSVFLTLNYFRKYSLYCLIAVLIYFSHVFLLRDMLQIRAGLAASISLYSFKYIETRKIVKFILIIIAGALFHTGVCILGLVYFLYPFFKDKFARLFLLLIIGFLLGVILSPSLLLLLFTEKLQIPGVSLYVADPEFFNTLGLLNPVLIKSIIVFTVAYLLKNQLSKRVPYYNVYNFSLLISITWLATFNNFSIFAGRLATFMSNTEHLLIPAFFLSKYNKILLWLLVVAYCLIMFRAKFEIFNNLTFYFIP